MDFQSCSAELDFAPIATKLCVLRRISRNPRRVSCHISPRRGGIWWCLPIWMCRSRCVKHFLKCVHVVDRRIEDAVGPGTRRGTQRGFWRFAERLKRIFIWQFLDPGFVKRTFWSAKHTICACEIHNMDFDPSKLCAKHTIWPRRNPYSITITWICKTHNLQFALLRLPKLSLLSELMYSCLPSQLNQITYEILP